MIIRRENIGEERGGNGSDNERMMIAEREILKENNRYFNAGNRRQYV